MVNHPGMSYSTVMSKEPAKIAVASLPFEQAIQELEQHAPALGHTFSQALAQSRIGVFAKLVDAEHRLRDGDRIECYRLLQIDPKESRRRRAAVQAARRAAKPA